MILIRKLRCSKTSVIYLAIALACISRVHAQTVIQMEEEHGVFFIPCTVNKLPLRFIFDTGASSICISITEALFMLKNGYLNEEDILETEYYQIANGDIEEGTKIKIKELVIGNIALENLEATVFHNLDAPLLLGQTAFRKLGDIAFNYENKTLTIAQAGVNKYFKDEKQDDQDDVRFVTRFAQPFGPNVLYEKPDVYSFVVYKFTEDIVVSVIENEGVFCKVKVAGMTGYIQKEYLERKW